MPFDTGVGFAFTGRDAGLSGAAKGAASSIGMIGSAVDTVGTKLEANAENVKDFLKEFSQQQLDRIKGGLEEIASSASVNQTSLEGMAAAASKAARPIVASLGLTGKAAKKAKGQIVGLSIGLNVGAEAVGNAVKAWRLYEKELKAVGIDSVKTATKFQEVSGVQIDKMGAQLADLTRSWGLTEAQLGDLVPWILEAGKAFGFGSESIQSLGDVTAALDENLSKVLLKNGPEAIMRFTKGIYGLSLAATEALGMDFPAAMQQSLGLFQQLAGDMTTFQKTFSGLGDEFGPMAEKLGLAIGDWDTAFKMVQQDPLEFAKQMRVLVQSMEGGDQSSQMFLNRLKLTLGEDSAMLRFFTEQSEEMDKTLGKLEGVQAGTDSLKEFGNQAFSTGRTMAERLDLMRERAVMSFMAISKRTQDGQNQWSNYVKNLSKGYRTTTTVLKDLASDTEPGGIGYLINAASMGFRFGPGGAIAALFPKAAGTEAMGMLDSLSDALVDFLPHLTAMGALGFRPSMLAEPFKFALGPLKALSTPLLGFNTLMGGIPGMALKVFGPLGALALIVGGFTLFSRKWMGDQENAMATFIKDDLPVAIMRGFQKLTMGAEWTREMDKAFMKSWTGKSSEERWEAMGKMLMDGLGKGLSLAMEAFEVGTEVMVDMADRLADGIIVGLDKVDWEKFGTTLAKILMHLTGAAGKIIEKTPKIVMNLVKGLIGGLSKVNWSDMLKGSEKDMEGAAKGIGETMRAGIGWENILGAGALIGVPLMLRKFKKIKKEGGSIMGALRKDVSKGVPPEAAGLPKCIPTCAGAEGVVRGPAAAGGKIPAGAAMAGAAPVIGGRDPLGLGGPAFKKASLGTRLQAALGLRGVSQTLKKEGAEIQKSITAPMGGVMKNTDKMMRGVDKQVVGFQKDARKFSSDVMAPVRKDIGRLDSNMRQFDKSVVKLNKTFPELGMASKALDKQVNKAGASIKKSAASMGAAMKRMGGTMKSGASRAMGWKGAMGMGAMGGLAPGMMLGAKAMAGEDVGLVEGGIGYGTALAMGGPEGLAVAALMTGAGGAVNEFQTNWEGTMERIEESGGGAAAYVEESFALSMQSISEGMDDMTLGLTEMIRDETAKWLGINKVTGEQIGMVWRMVWHQISTPFELMIATFMDGLGKVTEGSQYMLDTLIKSSEALWKGWSAYIKGALNSFYSWGLSLVSKGKVFFLEMQYEIMKVVQGMVLSSMQLFSSIFRPMADVFADMKGATRAWMQENLPGFKALDDMVTGLADEVDKKVTKKSLEYMKANLDVQRKIVEGKAEGLRLEQQANMEMQKGKSILGAESKYVQGMMEGYQEAYKESLKGMLGVAEAVPIGVIGLFAPGIFDALGFETAADWAKAGEEKWAALTKELSQAQEDAYEVTGEEQATMLHNAMAAAESTVEDMAKGLADAGVKKGREKAVTSIAEKALGQMAKADTPEDLKAAMEAAAKKGKTPAEKAAIANMLTGAAGAMFQYGPQIGKEETIGSMEKKMVGEMKKEGMTFLEQAFATGADVAEEAAKKTKKKKRKAKLKETAEQYEKASEAIGEAGKAAPAVKAPPTVPMVEIPGLGVSMPMPTPTGPARAPAASPQKGSMTIHLKQPLVNGYSTGTGQATGSP